MHDKKGHIFIQWLIPWEYPKFLQCQEGHLLRFAALKPAMEKQKQCMMRGTSHPTGPQGRTYEKIKLGMETHPISQVVPLEKKEKSSAWSEGIFHPICRTLGRPHIPSV